MSREADTIESLEFRVTEAIYSLEKEVTDAADVIARAQIAAALISAGGLQWPAGVSTLRTRIDEIMNEVVYEKEEP